jgi:UDP-N-acetylmuramoyl-L-alanyl-D-glutamate--2,6-diaminopimelate ligase
MLLKDLLYKVSIEAVLGSTDVAITKIEFDSRKIEFNDVFVALKGVNSDGHLYIENTIKQGAIAVICQEKPSIIVNGITYIVVKNSNEALAIMAANFYDNPSKKLNLVGITGTNGKTTVATLSYQLFKNAGYKAGLLSTVKIMVDNQEYKATHTTPDSLTINYFLNEMVQKGVTHCFMEVSSHGIDQKRTHGLHFIGGVFTNLSHDHLDYHPSFAAYRDVKKSFFDHLDKNSFAITNVDDKNGIVMLQNTLATKLTYSMNTLADFKATPMESDLSGTLLKINDQELWIKLIGKFNIYNVLAIYGIATQLGVESLEALKLLSELESVSGRFQYIVSKNNITAIVDYAHTPDALQNVLATINGIRTHVERLITVVGCGGDRDKTKRPIMAKIATEMSNTTILTSDNPRTEDPQVILIEMEKGIEAQNSRKFISVLDRKQAIKTACSMAKGNDIILIAGKGHENYQEINGVKYPFDDMEIVKEFLNY